jgi:tetratricopeptide (TPR) repeat protein
LSVAFSLLTLSFAVATFVRAEAWADEVTLWSSTFRDSPDNQHVACAQLGRLYMRAGLLAHALSLYRGCAVTPSSRFIMLSNGASVLARAGRYREALAALDGLAEPARKQPLVSLNNAVFQIYLGNFGGARAALTRTLAADPTSPKALALARQLPSIERTRQQLDALPDGSAILERARLLQKLGLTAESSRAWQLALESGSLSPEQFREGLAFIVGQSDAETLEALHREYPMQFAPAESSELAHQYSERHELSRRLLAAWPGLGLGLRRLPGTIGP